MSKKQVRFSSKTSIINDKSNDTPMNSEVNSGKNAAENEKFQSDEDAVDGMWEKLVLYYLSRLKGLCDWRSYSWTPQGDSCNCNSSSKQSLESCFSDHLEDQIVKHVTEEALNDTKPNYRQNLAEIGTYMAAGYEEGKQQAAKIVIRSLKFGLLTGILKRDGSAYRIRQKYLDHSRPRKLSHCKIFKKTSYKPKQKYSKYRRGNGNHMTLRNGKKCYKKLTKNNKTKLKTSAKDGKEYKADKKFVTKFLRSISPLLGSSRSSSPKSNKSRDSARAQPSAKRKRSRIVIKKPVFPRPSGKRRGRSQTKSPTPTRSRSIRSVHRYKPRRLKCNGYETPEHRRCGSVLSSISSSAMSICTVCRRKRDRSNSNDSKTSKKFRGSSGNEL